MERTYNGVSEKIEVTELFIGTEVEGTKFHGKMTLFYDVNLHSDVDYLFQKCSENKVDHVYVGANKSIKCLSDLKEGVDYSTRLLARGLCVTLDVPIHLYNDVLSYVKGLTARDYIPGVGERHLRFCLMVSVEVPHIPKWAAISVKIDDIGFSATNNDIVVSSFCWGEFEKTEQTNWYSYRNDKLIGV